MLSEDEFRVINALYLRKMGNAELLARTSGVDAPAAQRILSEAGAKGMVVDLGGELMLGDDGRRAVLKFYDTTYAPLRANDAVIQWYGRFETLNAQFLETITEWQKTSGDERVQGRLVKIVERQIKALGQIEPDIPRYSVYRERFSAAIGNVDAGDSSYVVNPRVDSIHNIWFEFHEDILAVIGRPRETVDG
jgi:hypothetical protein